MFSKPVDILYAGMGKRKEEFIYLFEALVHRSIVCLFLGFLEYFIDFQVNV